ncbi:NAD(P)/FAD-dependent oxidoreductase [Cellulomonas iranensis]|uniref:NAD(P)/FAD-dependent oxidoreductase n=1 Tax=Cellulomonas iranensis TaxID=76862 RepID=UPI001F09B94B|nr:FAD-dependent oxidoreductase [Cellulomonas iranensis]
MRAAAAPPWADVRDPDGAGRVADRHRASLDGDTTADVVVVGAGATGLWTAYYLLEADPAIDVLVVDASTVGEGASSRTTGWCAARFPVATETLASRYGAAAARELRAALRDTVVEVGGVTAAEEIACDFAYGGHLVLARTPAQSARLAEAVASARRWDDEVEPLDADEAGTHLRAAGTRTAAWTPDSARVQPRALATGLARVVEQRGVRVAERTRVLRVSPRAVVTDQGTVRCRHVVHATGATPPGVPGTGRAGAATDAVAIATEPLPAPVWHELGLAHGTTFSVASRRAVHGHRSADDRLVLTARAGGPAPSGAHARLRAALVDLFPSLAARTVTHAWRWPLDVARDGYASVGVDPAAGLAWTHGHAEDGTALANLAGRTLADLLTGTSSALTRLPWVGHRSPAWPPGPAATAMLTAAAWRAARSDRTEQPASRPRTSRG